MIAGALLAQIRPGVTTAVTALTAKMLTEVKKIVICNTTGAPASYSVFHHDTGTTFDQTTALFYATVLAANTTAIVNAEDASGGIAVANAGAIGVQSSVISALTFTFYGSTQQAR